MIVDRSRKSIVSDDRKLIGFMLGDVQYGIDIMRIREIINPSAVVEMPSSPPYVIGVADHRKVVVPIIDVKLRFGLPTDSDSRRTKWLLINMDDQTVGLRVECVTDVIRVTESDRRDGHPLIENGEKAWVQTIYGTKKGLVFELDLEMVVRPGDIMVSEMDTMTRGVANDDRA